MSDLAEKMKMFSGDGRVTPGLSNESIDRYKSDMQMSTLRYRTLKDPRVLTTFPSNVIPFADFLSSAIKDQAIIDITMGDTTIECVVLDLPDTTGFLPVIKITKGESYSEDVYSGGIKQRHTIHKLKGVRTYVAISSITRVSYVEDENTFGNSAQFR